MVDVSGVVGMPGGVGIGKGKTGSDLSDGVGISLGVSAPLADVVGSVDGGVGRVGGEGRGGSISG